jgi:8-oxo-dGTP diphosphatase
MKENFFSLAFSVDNVILGFDDAQLKVLLIKRGEEPYKDYWALPGALIFPNEDLDYSASRVLSELTGLRDMFLEQVFTFGRPDRHPNGRVITVAYYSLINIQKVKPVAASFAQEVEWHDVYDMENLAFDHKEIMDTCLNHLRREVRTRPIGFELLPVKFTLTDLQLLYEAVLNKELDKRNFRKKILSMHILVDIKESQRGVAHRPAKLYSFDKDKYLKARSQGFHFEL